MSASLTVRQVRAKILLDEIRANPERVDHVEDVALLPRLTGWAPAILQDALDELVDRGSLVEAADGRLCVIGWRAGR
ncbi:MAG: hypothetical protein WKF94_18740 [Solirubrobacteraceae bacterium]